MGSKKYCKIKGVIIMSWKKVSWGGHIVYVQRVSPFCELKRKLYYFYISKKYNKGKLL